MHQALQLVDGIDDEMSDNSWKDLLNGMLEYHGKQIDRIAEDVSDIKAKQSAHADGITRVHKRIDRITKPMMWFAGLVITALVTASVTVLIKVLLG